MINSSRPGFKLGSGANLAFAIVVLASYFAMFSASASPISLVDIALLMGLGVAYIAIGIYGFTFCYKHPNPLLKLVYFCIQVPLGGVIVYLGKGAGFNALILMPLVGQGVMLLSQVWILITNTVVVLTYIGSVSLFSKDPSSVWSGLPTFLAGVIFIMIFTQMAVDEEKARTEVERLVDELEQANQRLRGYAMQVEELAVTKERNRLAREIHDGLGHYLTAIHMQIQAALAVMDSDKAHTREMLKAAQNLTQDALEDVRQSVASLREASNDTRPVSEKIAALFAECHLDGIQPEFRVVGSPRDLTPQAQLTLFRSAQEGLNNVRKHSQASKVSATLDYTSQAQVRLIVQDDGVGTDHFDGGFGLLGIRERTHILNGEVEYTSEKGKGFILEVVLPE